MDVCYLFRDSERREISQASSCQHSGAGRSMGSGDLGHKWKDRVQHPAAFTSCKAFPVLHATYVMVFERGAREQVR